MNRGRQHFGAPSREDVLDPSEQTARVDLGQNFRQGTIHCLSGLDSGRFRQPSITRTHDQPFVGCEDAQWELLSRHQSLAPSTVGTDAGAELADILFRVACRSPASTL